MPSLETDFQTALQQADDEPATLVNDKKAARRALSDAGLDEAQVEQFQAHVAAQFGGQVKAAADKPKNAGQAQPGNTLRKGKVGPQLDKNRDAPEVDVNLVLRELRRQKGFNRDVGRLEQKRAEYLDAKAAGLNGEAEAAMQEMRVIQSSIDRSLKAEVAALSKNDKQQLRWSEGHQEVVLQRAKGVLHADDKVARDAFQGSRTTPPEPKMPRTKAEALANGGFEWEDGSVHDQPEHDEPKKGKEKDGKEKDGIGKRVFGWASKTKTHATGKLVRQDFPNKAAYDAYIKEEAEIKAETQVRRREKLQKRGLRVRQIGILGTILSAIRLVDVQAKRVAVGGLLLGILFVPVGFLTFAGWSIVAAAMVLLSAVYFVFLNIVKVISAGAVGFINLVFSFLASASIALAEPVLLFMGKAKTRCTFADGTQTEEAYAFCSGRIVASEGLVPASALKAIDIPLLDPRKLMPTMNPKPLIQYAAEAFGFTGLDLGSFFARAFNGPIADFIAGGSIYRVILVFVVPTVLLGGWAYVALVRPALQAAGVKH